MCETTAQPSAELQILRRLGYFGYYLHTHWGGRNGKQHILVELLAHDGCMTQRDLQEASCITSASLSEVVTKLETEGLVSHATPPSPTVGTPPSRPPTRAGIARETSSRAAGSSRALPSTA